jgi:hypothetical protein
VSQEETKVREGKEWETLTFPRITSSIIPLLVHCYILKMKAEGYSETLEINVKEMD